MTDVAAVTINENQWRVLTLLICGLIFGRNEDACNVHGIWQVRADIFFIIVAELLRCSGVSARSSSGLMCVLPFSCQIIQRIARLRVAKDADVVYTSRTAVNFDNEREVRWQTLLIFRMFFGRLQVYLCYIPAQMNIFVDNTSAEHRRCVSKEPVSATEI